MIPNHYSATLSALDLQMVRSVPPGGNWKNIPLTIPSRRLEQIRVSYAAGTGSRSTYYGRLNPDNPSHTISTYFGRPGNGCFIHYAQNRMISQREAARLQGFPDSFTFCGSKTAINKQIGNAVPPVLAYQFAKSFGEAGSFVDLFSGAGGLSLGFEWAGWSHVVANDIEKTCLETYERNLGGEVVLGDITQREIRQAIIDKARKALWRSAASGPRVVLGGPPCQGFSTAGKKRSMGDARNHLFKNYAQLLADLQPDAFLFENVPGLKSMESGRVMAMVLEELQAVGYETRVWVLKTDDYAVPQRRTRIIIVGTRGFEWKRPATVTRVVSSDKELEWVPPCPSVKASLDDLPPIEPGEDGTELEYRTVSKTDYQRFARGEIFVDEYLTRIGGSGRNGCFESRSL